MLTNWLAPPALAAAFILGACSANAQQAPDIFARPPDEAFGLGLVLAYDGGVVTVIQGEGAIREACGVAFGCIGWIGESTTLTCQLHIWTGLPDDLEVLAIRNLIARCSGWTPIGE